MSDVSPPPVADNPALPHRGWREYLSFGYWQRNLTAGQVLIGFLLLGAIFLLASLAWQYGDDSNVKKVYQTYVAAQKSTDTWNITGHGKELKIGGPSKFYYFGLRPDKLLIVEVDEKEEPHVYVLDPPNLIPEQTNAYWGTIDLTHPMNTAVKLHIIVANHDRIEYNVEYLDPTSPSDRRPVKPPS